MMFDPKMMMQMPPAGMMNANGPDGKPLSPEQIAM
jgi:hypothetical protein